MNADPEPDQPAPPLDQAGGSASADPTGKPTEAIVTRVARIAIAAHRVTCLVLRRGVALAAAVADRIVISAPTGPGLGRG
jgi:hypothetical protein